jgi:hypothetical protein
MTTRKSKQATRTAKAVSDARTTARAIANVVAAGEIVYHVEFDVKAKATTAGMSDRLAALNVAWGNIPKGWEPTKSLTEVKCGHDVSVWTVVITNLNVQCPMCGNPDRDSKFCPVCQGEITPESSIIDDIE